LYGYIVYIDYLAVKELQVDLATICTDLSTHMYLGIFYCGKIEIIVDATQSSHRFLVNKNRATATGRPRTNVFSQRRHSKFLVQ
jgi:hypothetical protein